MVVISKSVLNQFIEQYPKSAEAVLRWYLLCKENDWSAFEDIKKVFPATDAVGNDLYVFNVGGNKFRIIVRIIFKARTIFIRFIGTHSQYDKVKLSDL
jgi:mRNA interferase HigB